MHLLSGLVSFRSLLFRRDFCTGLVTKLVLYFCIIFTPPSEFVPSTLSAHLLAASTTTQAFSLHRPSQQEQLFRVIREQQQNLLFDVPTTKEQYEIAQVKFLTPLRSRRDLSEREIHILEVKRPATNSTLTVHLTKKTTLLSPLLTVSVWDGDGNVTKISPEEHQGTIFSGTVTSASHPRSDPTAEDKQGNEKTTQTSTSEGFQGQAALSVCHEHAGFCGLIVTDNEHLILQPDPHSKARTTTDEIAESLPLPNSKPESANADEQVARHVILRVDQATSTSTCVASDELRVPIEKLREASALAASELKARGHDHEISDIHIHSQSQSEMDRTKYHLGTLEEAIDDDHNDDKVRNFPASLLTPVPPGHSGSRSGSGRSRTEGPSITSPSLSPRNYFHPDPFGSSIKTMALTNKKTIEIAVFTDEDLYTQMRKKFPKDTIKKMKDYVITMVNSMDLLYQHNSLGVEIEFSLVHLEIMKKYPSKLNKNGGRAMAYLTSFCDYAGEKNVNSDMWDHALLLTGMDLREDDTSATAGLAWAGTMCYRYYSCSVSEGTSFGAAYIITHEIGHSLGMEHDGNGVSKSCDRDKFIMSPTTGPGKIEWSPCSKKNFKDFLQYGTSELRNSKAANKPLCLSETSMRNTPQKVNNGASGVVSTSSNSLPGQKYNASQQCMLAMGSRFKPVLRKAEPPFDNICWMLYCGNGTHAVSTHPALEGSKCDDGKHCRSGKCIMKPRV